MKKSLYSLIFVIALCFSLQAIANDDFYTYGGEDFSYDYELDELIPIEYYKVDVKSSVEGQLPKIEAAVKDNRPKIAIIIDDMGVNREMSKKALDLLDPEITLSFLPYAKDVQKQVNVASKKGHEIMLHLPWEPDSPRVNPGPNSLLTKNSLEDLRKKLKTNLDSFEGYVGVNNHMGSKFSRYREGIEMVMSELKKRGKFFLDSKTTANTIAEKIAREYSVPTTHRNIFLDHGKTKEFVDNALSEVEKVSREKGYAIAIGHPKEFTISALEKWIPTLEEKGFKLVGLQEIIDERQVIYNSSASHIKNVGNIKGKYKVIQ